MTQLGNIQFTAVYSAVPTRTYVWREKDMWWNSLCKNKLILSSDTKVSIRTKTVFGSYGDGVTDMCEVFIYPSGV